MRWFSLSNPIKDETKNSYFREMFLPESISKSLSNKNQYLAYSHQPNKVLLKIGDAGFEINCDKIGLYFRARLPETILGNSILYQLQQGSLRHMSVGFINQEFETIYDKGKTFHVVKRADLREISFVHTPAYKSTSVRIIQNIREEIFFKIDRALNSK